MIQLSLLPHFLSSASPHPSPCSLLLPPLPFLLSSPSPSPPPHRGDHTTASCNLFVVPPRTQAVVFSVDGALASNFSLSAKDIRLKPSAVEVARYVKKIKIKLYLTAMEL